MTVVMLVLIIAFVVMLVINVPIGVAIALSTFFSILATGAEADYAVAMRMANGVDSFALLAVPFFVLSGILMGRGGMARRLVDRGHEVHIVTYPFGEEIPLNGVHVHRVPALFNETEIRVGPTSTRPVWTPAAR